MTEASTGGPVPHAGGLGQSFVLEEQKVVYVPVPKAACSSLKWLIADLQGEDFAAFYGATRTAPTRLQTIHSRWLWGRTPTLRTYLREHKPETLCTEDGWFVFGVVRDPWSRIWSAWQSKLLVRMPKYVESFGDQDWFPRIPERAEDAIEDFRRFVAALLAGSGSISELFRDPHFRDQASRLDVPGLTYTRIYDLAEMSELFSDLTAHLHGQGIDHEFLMVRANDTPLTLRRDVFDDATIQAVREAYAVDFAEYGELWDFDKVKVRDKAWSEDALEDIRYRCAAHERIGDLSRIAHAVKIPAT